MSMWFNVRETLTHNCLFNFILGERGVGKTYSTKMYAIDHFKKTGKQFIYLRRYEREFKKNSEFFKSICKEERYKNDELEVKGKTYLCNKEVMGHAITLSTAQTLKSAEFPDVDLIIFDEFIIMEGIYRYLKDEVTFFLEFYETVSRLRDVRVLFLGNNVSYNNPYFNFFHIIKPYGKNFYKPRHDILLQVIENNEYRDVKKKSRFGKLVSGTAYENYAINNNAYNDDNGFIMKKYGKCRLNFVFSYLNKTYGVWVNYEEGLYFVSEDYDPDFKLKFAFTRKDQQPNMLLITRVNQSINLKNFIKAYKLGILYFENSRIKAACSDLFKIIM